ncbi:LacI family DNA-binding transcriptional regulator [Ideonella livida]|uniref:LacI family transcriptional regulator n=1 Tax=Ideonella livida TaxID=2707176 RepID=A0A7C9TN49_9BURK|nr:LacI family DNA-binding transcriptional regulator [Ideonella livida]NDY93744.1 LacI family transcriptional regulator [Ideonella livida]
MTTSGSSFRKVTASDVAALAGVSKGTVSRAFTPGAPIAQAQREKVLKIAAELGYSPNLLARSLATRKTYIIGLVLDEMATNPNQLALLNEVTRQLQARGYSSLLLNISAAGDAAQPLRMADQLQIDGLLFLGVTLTDALINFARDIKHIPLVVMFRNSADAGIPYVSTDGYQAGREIAALLLQGGHQRIGYMAGPTSAGTTLRRFEGFRDALEERGVQLAAVLQAEHYDHACGLRSLMRHWESTPREQRLQALFCENDILALGAMDCLVACNAARRVAIVGFDDIALAAAPSYDLTTFRQPMEFLVGEAVSRLLDPTRQTAGSCLAPGTLVLRTSHLGMAN